MRDITELGDYYGLKIKKDASKVEAGKDIAIVDRSDIGAWVIVGLAGVIAIMVAGIGMLVVMMRRKRRLGEVRREQGAKGRDILKRMIEIYDAKRMKK